MSSDPSLSKADAIQRVMEAAKGQHKADCNSRMCMKCSHSMELHLSSGCRCRLHHDGDWPIYCGCRGEAYNCSCGLDAALSLLSVEEKHMDNIPDFYESDAEWDSGEYASLKRQYDALKAKEQQPVKNLRDVLQQVADFDFLDKLDATPTPEARQVYTDLMVRVRLSLLSVPEQKEPRIPDVVSSEEWDSASPDRKKALLDQLQADILNAQASVSVSPSAAEEEK